MRSSCIIASAAFVVLGFCCSGATAKEGIDPFPKSNDVKQVTIKFDHPKDGDVEFTASLADWKSIRASILPAKRDDHPKKWESFGNVMITKKDDSTVRVSLYSPGKGSAAFAVGKTVKQRIYYRGGKQSNMHKAVIAAYDKSKDSLR